MQCTSKLESDRIEQLRFDGGSGPPYVIRSKGLIGGIRPDIIVGAGEEDSGRLLRLVVTPKLL